MSGHRGCGRHESTPSSLPRASNVERPAGRSAASGPLSGKIPRRARIDGVQPFPLGVMSRPAAAIVLSCRGSCSRLCRVCQECARSKPRSGRPPRRQLRSGAKRPCAVTQQLIGCQASGRAATWTTAIRRHQNRFADEQPVTIEHASAQFSSAATPRARSYRNEKNEQHRQGENGQREPRPTTRRSRGNDRRTRRLRWRVRGIRW